MKRKEIYKLNKGKKVGDKCICPICKCEFTKTHYAQAFCCNECKVKFHNDRQRGKRNDYFRKYNMKHPKRKLRRALYSMEVHNSRDADEDKSALEARTDNELVEEVYSHLDSIKETADRMTSGNFMHNKAAIKFSANTITKVLELIGIKAQKDSKYDNQNCVKPTDKVEPKFHEGEWLTENHPNNYAHFVQILEIVNVQGKKRYRKRKENETMVSK